MGSPLLAAFLLFPHQKMGRSKSGLRRRVPKKRLWPCNFKPALSGELN